MIAGQLTTGAGFSLVKGLLPAPWVSRLTPAKGFVAPPVKLTAEKGLLGAAEVVLAARLPPPRLGRTTLLFFMTSADAWRNSP